MVDARRMENTKVLDHNLELCALPAPIISENFLNIPKGRKIIFGTGLKNARL